ncbi:hypothetical protein [uncultured Bacteroides sp.]|uniref:hypothetical protein n=1 Tax=uncultured Bacteroides sp. TaxID=162156 RepID=UPI002622B74E|nr:hypothetical protein [uncultured Bacteroides sp.]
MVGTADEAIRQIREEGYAREYSAGPRRVFQIGAAFSSEAGTVSGWQSVWHRCRYPAKGG